MGKLNLSLGTELSKIIKYSKKQELIREILRKHFNLQPKEELTEQNNALLRINEIKKDKIKKGDDMLDKSILKSMDNIEKLHVENEGLIKNAIIHLKEGHKIIERQLQKDKENPVIWPHKLEHLEPLKIEVIKKDKLYKTFNKNKFFDKELKKENGEDKNNGEHS